MDREKINGWDEASLTQILTGYILVFESCFRYRISNLMIQDDPESRLTGLQLLCWSLFLILSFDKWYSVIYTPTNCRSELNIHIKSSLEIRGGFKFKNIQLFLSSYSSNLSISFINTCNLKGKRDDHAEIGFGPVFHSL